MLRYVYMLIVLSLSSMSFGQELIACYHSDISGNVIAMSDGLGNPITKYVYSPYGQTLSQEAVSNNPYKFSGSFGVIEELPELYFMRARYYSVDACRFLSTDPIKNVGPGWKPNLYLYAINNPTLYSDPTGLLVKTIGGVIGFSGSVWLEGSRSYNIGIAFDTDNLFSLDGYGIYETTSTSLGFSFPGIGVKGGHSVGDHFVDDISDLSGKGEASYGGGGIALPLANVGAGGQMAFSQKSVTAEVSVSAGIGNPLPLNVRGGRTFSDTKAYTLVDIAENITKRAGKKLKENEKVHQAISYAERINSVVNTVSKVQKEHPNQTKKQVSNVWQEAKSKAKTKYEKTKKWFKGLFEK